MGNFEDWFAAMPVEDVRRRIADLEQELEVMRVLERRHGKGARQVTLSSARSPRPEITQRDVLDRAGRTYRVSPERQAITDVIRQSPDGMSPVEVARALGKEPNPIQTNMSRMTRAGMLVRVGQALYRVPDQITPPDDLLHSAQSAVEEVKSP